MTESLTALPPIAFLGCEQRSEPCTLPSPRRHRRAGPCEEAPATGDECAQLAAIGQGDEVALAAFYDRYAGLVLAVLERMLGHGGEAEETLQEVFLQVWRQAGRYRPELASPRGWLLLLTRSRALDRLKASQAARRRDEAVGSEWAGRTSEPEVVAALARSEDRRRIRRALGALSPEQRQAIELAFYGGLSHSQVAARLGAPLGTVKSRILLGMRKLRQALEGPTATAAFSSLVR